MMPLSGGASIQNRAFAFENSGYIIFGHSEARTEMLRRIADRYRRISLRHKFISRRVGAYPRTARIARFGDITQSLSRQTVTT
jgi:hypothetical protein